MFRGSIRRWRAELAGGCALATELGGDPCAEALALAIRDCGTEQEHEVECPRPCSGEEADLLTNLTLEGQARNGEAEETDAEDWRL